MCVNLRLPGGFVEYEGEFIDLRLYRVKVENLLTK